MIKIAKDVYQIPLAPSQGLNTYLIEDVLVDAGSRVTTSKLLKELEGKNINAHVLTHSHLDHQGGSKEIIETLKIPLWCGEKERDLVENGQKFIGYRFPKSGLTELLNQKGMNPTCKVNDVLKEGDIVGGFQVINTPGHTKGHICLFREEDGVAIVGDILLNMNVLTLKEGLHLPPLIATVNQTENLASIRKIMDLKPKLLCFGHGKALTDVCKVTQFLKIFNK